MIIQLEKNDEGSVTGLIIDGWGIPLDSVNEFNNRKGVQLVCGKDCDGFKFEIVRRKAHE